MSDEIELYLRRKRGQQGVNAPADTSVQTLDVSGEPAFEEPTADAYIVRKNELRQQKAAVTALRVENSGNPDENAADAQLASEYQTHINPEVTPPPSFVATNRDRMQADLRRYRMTTTLSSSPMLMRWLDNTENARLAADDVGILSEIEAGLASIRTAMKRGFIDRFAQTGSQYVSDANVRAAEQRGLTFGERYREARGAHYGSFFGALPEGGEYVRPDGNVDIDAIAATGTDQISAFFSAAKGAAVDLLLDAAGKSKDDLLARAADFQQSAAVAAGATPLAEGGRHEKFLNTYASETPLTLGEAAQRTLDLLVNDPATFFAGIGLVGVESLGSIIPAAVVTAATRNPLAGAATMGATSYAIERNLAPVEFFAERGYDLTKPEDVQRMLANPDLMKEAAEKGHTRGLIIGALDWASGGIAGKALAKNPLADAAIQSMVQAGLGGGGEGLAQLATDGEVDFGEVIVEALAEFAPAPVDVALIGGRKLGERREASRRAGAMTKALEHMVQKVTASKLRERSPENFRAFVAEATEGGTTETMYIPADAFVEFFQSQGVEIDAIAEALPGVDIEQVRRAAVTGEEVVVPTATYLAHVAGTDVDAFIVDNAKFAPDDMTRAEAMAFLEDEQLQEARVSAEQEAFRATQQAETDIATILQNELVEQLVAAGRPRAAAQQEAQLYPAFYRTLAHRLGMPLEDLVARYRPPEVRGPEVAPLQDRQVDAITRDMAALRARLTRQEGAPVEGGAPTEEYLDAVEKAVRDVGLDPATATDDEVRAALGVQGTEFMQRDEVFGGGLRGDGRKFRDFFADVTTGVRQQPTGLEDYKPAISTTDEMVGFANVRDTFSGNFERHIQTSIPGYREAQDGIGVALVKAFGDEGAQVLDIGGSEGAMLKAAATLTEGKIGGVILDPNPAMMQTFNDKPDAAGVRYQLSAFGDAESAGEVAWTEDDGTDIPVFTPDVEGYDFVYEAMVFQFISNSRGPQVARVKELMKEGGVFVTQEKLGGPAEEYNRNETKKDKYKSQYYDEATLEAKRKEVLQTGGDAIEGMTDLQVSDSELRTVLANNFENVVQIWDSGNFKGYAASDNIEALRTFVDALPPLDSEYATRSTPEWTAGVGTPATPADFAALTPETLQKPGWAAIAATEEAVGAWDHPTNLKRTDELRASLPEGSFIEVKGMYAGAEQGSSFLVFDTPENALKLAAEYNQESVLTRDGLVYADGRVTPAAHSNTIVGPEATKQDFYSVMPDGTAWALGLDWDATTEAAPTQPLTLYQSGIPLFDDPLRIEGKVTVRAVAQAMTDDHMARHGRQLFPEDNDGDFDAVLAVAFDEVRAQLAQLNSGVGWYSKDVDLALRETEKALPGVNTPDGRAVMLTFAGIFSNGNTPTQAWGIAAEAYEAWRATGTIPITRVQASEARGAEVRVSKGKDKKTGASLSRPAGWSVRTRVNEQHLAMFATLVERLGSPDAAAQWLMTEQSREDINAVMIASGMKAGRYKSQKEKAGPPAYGALIFGEKLGRYTVGLYGVPVGADDTTVDQWYTRTFRRWVGRLLEGPLDTTTGIVGQPNPAREGIERRTIFRLTGELAKAFGLSVGDTQAVLWFFEKRLWGAQGVRTDEGTNSAGAKKLLEERGLKFDEREGGGGAGPRADSASPRGAGNTSTRDQGNLTTELFQRDVPQTETTAFKTFFGDSVAVDDTGEPLPVYHGTNETITTFRSGKPVWLTPSLRLANTYMKDRFQTSGGTQAMVSAYIRLENPLTLPFDMNAPAMTAQELSEKVGFPVGEIAPDGGSDPSATFRPTEWVNTPAFAAAAAERGYDGLSVEEGGVQSFAVFDPAQVKSRHRNSGAFDRTDPDIYQQEGGARGRILLPAEGMDSGRAVIDLFKSANLSTFLHETGHYFLSVLRDAATREGAPADVAGMYESTRGWWRNNAAEVAKEASEVDLSRVGLAQAPAQQQTGTPEFKAGFEDSKVVDENGNPLVVYHGTKENFDTFNIPAFFTEHADEAGAYTEAQTLARREAALKRLAQRYRLVRGDAGIEPGMVPYVGIIEDAWEITRTTTDPNNRADALWATDQGVVRLVFEPKGDLARVDLLEDWIVEYGSSSGDSIRIKRGDNKKAVREIIQFSREIIDQKFPPGEGEGGSVMAVYLNITNPKEVGPFEANRLGKRLDAMTEEEVKAYIAEVKAEGYDGIVTRSDEGSLLPHLFPDGVPRQWIAFSPTQIKSATGNRGTYDLGDPNVLNQNGKQTGENKVTEADVVRYLDDGTTGDATKDVAVHVAMHEQWARAFETYVLEGKAPTSALRGAFEQFRAWLLEVYRKVKGDLNVPVTDDIRQVFDMLLATDAEIAAATEDNSGGMIAASAAELGISGDDYQQLAKLHQEARDEMAARAIRDAMAPIRRAREADYRERRAEIEAEVAAEVNARPVYRAIEWMGNKRWLGSDNAPSVPNGLRLSKEQLVERYGPGVLRTLPRGSFRVYTPGGMDIDEAAGWFGFTSGDEMVKAMEAAPRRTDVIASETDVRAAAELSKDAGVVDAAEAANAAFHTDKRGDYIAAELRTLNIKVGGKDGVSTASYARQVARTTISKMKVRDAIASSRYLAAERRAAEAAQVAFVGGDLKTATDQKRKQLFNHMMYTESRKVADEVGLTERLAKRLERKGTRKNLAKEYLGAIDDVLAQYDFRKIGPGREQRRERLLAYVEMMKAQGRENELAIPQHVLDDARPEPYMTLPVERLRGVHATLKNIESTARRAQKLIDAKREREMDQIVNDISDAFAANVKARPPARVPGRGEAARRGMRQYLDVVLNADTLLREIDGFGDGVGATYENLKQGLDEATARLQVRRQEAANAFEKLYSVYETKERNRMAVPEFHPELNASMAKWDLIAIVFNMGNADNIQRLTDPKVKGAFTKQQLDWVVSRMEKRDMDFIQSVWDYVGSFYAEIAAREKRVTGVAPQRVEAQPLMTAHGQYRGGYYPLKYDPRLSSRVVEESAEEVMNNMRAGRFGKAQTRNGHTKERAQSSGRAVLLDIGVLHSHINTVLHDLELSEQVTNTWRILQEPRIKGLFYDAGKQVDHQALEMWVQDTASGQVNSADVLSRTARFLKSGFTVSKLAFNLSTVAIQITGVAQSMVVIGKKNFVKGAAQYLHHPVQTSRDVVARSNFMAERETTFNKDIYDVVGDLKVGPKAGVYKRAMQTYIGPLSFFLMQKVQFYAVDMPTWLGSYQKALASNGNDEAAAIQAADRDVARAQASGIFSDRSPIERGTLNPSIRQNDFIRMFTALGSYMFAKANVAYERTGKTDFRSPREVLSYTFDMVLLFTVEAVLYNAIKGTLPGMGDDEDEEEWFSFLARETALSAMSTLPFVRDLASPLQGYSGGGSYGSISETLTKPFLQAAQGEVDKALVKSFADATGMLLHLPSTQGNRFIDAWWRASEGEDVAPIEYIMGKR